MNYGYIYKTTNTLTGKPYIGQKKGKVIQSYFGSGRYIKNAIKGIGKESFKMEVVCFLPTKEQLDEFEIFLIAKYREILGKEGLYNISDGGDGGGTQIQQFIDYNKSTAKSDHSRQMMLKRYKEDPNWNKEACSIGGKTMAQRLKVDPEFKKRVLVGFDLGRTPEARKKAMESLKNTLSLPEMNKKLSLRGRKQMDAYLKIPENVSYFSKLGRNLGANSGRNKSIVVALLLLKENLSFTRENWEIMRLRNFYHFPRYESLSRYFKNIEELKSIAQERITNYEEISK